MQWAGPPDEETAKFDREHLVALTQAVLAIQKLKGAARGRAKQQSVFLHLARQRILDAHHCHDDQQEQFLDHLELRAAEEPPYRR